MQKFNVQKFTRHEEVIILSSFGYKIARKVMLLSSPNSMFLITLLNFIHFCCPSLSLQNSPKYHISFRWSVLQTSSNKSAHFVSRFVGKMQVPIEVFTRILFWKLKVRIFSTLFVKKWGGSLTTFKRRGNDCTSAFRWLPSAILMLAIFE